MTHANRICALFAVLTATWFASTSTAALAPGTIKKMKAKAADVVEVKVTKVEEKGRGREKLTLLYTATVTQVDRSKSGIKVGDSIEIESYRIVSAIALVGPKQPPLLKAGWTGTVFLNAPGGDGPYQIAVYGHSFVAKGE